MEILVSGLVETTGMEAVHAMAGGPQPYRWIAAESLDTPEGKQLLADRELVWTYDLPWRYASDAIEAAPFERWLSANRHAMNLRRQLGRRLSLVAVTPCGGRDATDALMNGLIASAIPEIGEMLSMLDASDLRVAQSGATPAGHDSRELLAELGRMLATARCLREERAEHEKQLAGLAARQRSLAASESAAKLAADAALRELRDTQVALEQQFLETRKLRAEVAAEKAARAKEKEAAGRLAVEQALRASLEAERAMHLQRIEGMAALVARSHERLDQLQARLHAEADSWLPGKFRRAARRVLRRSAADAGELGQVRRIADSEWFDAEWYLASYPDVRVAGIAPAEHYMTHGWKEGRNPGPAFDTLLYLERYPDVGDSGMNPLWHFIEFGHAEGRIPDAAVAPAGETGNG